MILLDGKLAASATKKVIKEQVDEWLAKGKRSPHLAAILVGSNGASETYVQSKVKNCHEIGFQSTLVRMEDSVSEEELVRQIDIFNEDENIDGILVQLPLPKHISEEKIIHSIAPYKDVDGFHPINLGKLVQGIESFVPATPLGIMLLLAYYQIETKGKHAVVIGRSNIVGRPMSILLSQNSQFGNCTVTLCHSHTKELEKYCLQADIIVAALGKPGFLKAEMVKEGAVIIDVGITRVPNAGSPKGFSIKGDVDFEQVAKKAAAITPVPGGVGLMTIAALLQNTLFAYTMKHN